MKGARKRKSWARFNVTFTRDIPYIAHLVIYACKF